MNENIMDPRIKTVMLPINVYHTTGLKGYTRFMYRGRGSGTFMAMT